MSHSLTTHVLGADTGTFFQGSLNIQAQVSPSSLSAGLHAILNFFLKHVFSSRVSWPPLLTLKYEGSLCALSQHALIFLLMSTNLLTFLRNPEAADAAGNSTMDVEKGQDISEPV